MTTPTKISFTTLRECDRAGLVFEVFSINAVLDRFKVDRHLLIVGCIEANFQLGWRERLKDVPSPTN